ncbi:hypothetical protein CAEBREN_06792 [Caenorhabditis brenneri]|uniref:DUF38 domain-containing protein n=1 Tax=Caenorhabditis brenneri TaxID=135651 RepID=G0M6U6_CAEBE|nr:hypothetical protein CAEBREN_06792 [Caenorhabditis brenneri]
MLDINGLSPEKSFIYCMFKANHDARFALYTANYTFPCLKLETIEEWYEEFKNTEHTENSNNEENDIEGCNAKKYKEVDEKNEQSCRERNDREDCAEMGEKNEKSFDEEHDDEDSVKSYKITMSCDERYDFARAMCKRDPDFLEGLGPKYHLPSPGYPDATMNVALNLDLHGILIEKKLDEGPNEATWFENTGISPIKPEFPANIINDSLNHFESILNEPDVKIEDLTIRYLNCGMLEDERKLLSNGIQDVLKRMEKGLIVQRLEIEVGDQELLEAFLATIRHGYLKVITITNHLLQVNKVAEVSRILKSGHWKYLQQLFVPYCQSDVSLSQLIDITFFVVVDGTQEDLKKYIVEKAATTASLMLCQHILVDHERLTMESFKGMIEVTTRCGVSDFCVIDKNSRAHYSVQSNGKEIWIMDCFNKD